MRAFWTGEVAFGLVTIPVKLYTATRDLTPHFRLLHKTCETPVVTVRRCPKHDKDLEWSEIGKGYEVSKGQYVLFTPEELAQLEGDEDRGVIEIVEFVDPLDVDRAYVEASYWAGPGGKNPRGYELLLSALDKTKRVALAKVRLRSRLRLALLRPRGGVFALDTMRFAEELVDGGELVPEKGKAPSPREMQLALGLIDQLSGTFDPEKVPDAYRSAVLAEAERKAKAGEARGAGPQEERAGAKVAGGKGAKVIDLAALLSQSIDASRKGRRGERKAANDTAARSGPRGERKAANDTAARSGPRGDRRAASRSHDKPGPARAQPHTTTSRTARHAAR